jgi:Domain of unknown function (DUF4062)/NACHT domain
MKTGQVFLSHTSDMALVPGDRPFAQAALDAVARAGMTPVDMRYFAARDGEPADYCRARVRECEIFVAVIGFRYGSIVPGEQVSYTELEFQAATAAGLPRLVFLLAETGSVEARADADPGLVEGFRKRLSEAGLVMRTFTSAAGLELEVLHALFELTGQARPGEIRTVVAAYLQMLIDWVNTDPWPRDRRFGGPVLTPAAIERRLRVFAPGRAAEQDLDADRVARECRRLVVLGGPGSGKTWLAKRTARRCAQDALDALAAGASLDQIELPLYTTCSRLFAASGDIRQAAVTSALEQLGDLGGPQRSAALLALFAERSAPVVLVIDSLDEAHGSRERLRQADTLPWRIVLTTRPSSWNQQLVIDDTDASHCVGELQRLSYPEDVEPFIRRWFGDQPERGADLAAQIARRPGLQQAATVPLVLAFYCIVGGREPLPEFRRELYGRVLNRMLTGRWRGDEGRQPDVGACLQTLRAWAWPGPDARHPVSGVGTWTDDILTERAELGDDDQDALDHVAMPLGPADVDTGQTLRRFIHRSIREHLVAEFVAGLPAGQAAELLLPHLWYDPDWEYSAPAAIAMHPQHDQLLRDLICRAARSRQLPGELSVIDAGWDLRGLLTRVVSESSEAGWSAELAGVLSRARAEQARSGRVDALGGAARWDNANRHIRALLLEMLASPAQAWAAGKLAGAVVELAATAQDKREARAALTGLLRGQRHGHEAARFAGHIAGAVAQLATTAQDKREGRAALTGLLAGQADSWVADEIVAGLNQLSPTEQDRRQARDVLLGLVPRQADGSQVAWLVGRVARLAATDEEKRETRDALRGLLASQADGWLAEEIAAWVDLLGPAAGNRRKARDPEPGPAPGQAAAPAADEPASMASWPAPPAEDRDLSVGALLKSLASETDARAAAGLAAAVREARPSAEEKGQARQVLLGLLATERDSRTAAELAGIVSRLAPAEEDNRRARQMLLRLLATEADGRKAAWLADGLIQAGPSAGEARQARRCLLRLLAGHSRGADTARLASRLSKLDPTADDQRQARQALLRSLADPAAGPVAARLAGSVSSLDPTPEDKRKARGILVRLLPGQTECRVAGELAGWIGRLDPAPEDNRQTRAALLGLLASQYGGPLAAGLIASVVRLAETAEDQRQTRAALLGLISAAQAGASATAGLVAAVIQLAPAADDMRQVRGTLLDLLAGQADGWTASELVTGVVQLGPTAGDKGQARDALLALLARQDSAPLAARLVDDLAQLDPTAADVSGWRAWAAPPTAELLAAVRRNCDVAAWLAILPRLPAGESSPRSPRT